MRNTTRTVPALLAAVLLLAVGVAGQTTESAQALLRTATDTALVDGDLRAAITQYQTIVETFETDRAVVATALVQMADSTRSSETASPATSTSGCCATTPSRPSR